MKTNKIIVLLTIFILTMAVGVIAPKGGIDKPPKDPPPTTDPLSLDHTGNQIVGVGGGAVTIWSYDAGTYSKSWTKEFSGAGEAAIGDVDDDGYDELVVVNYYQTGKGRNKVSHQEIQIFEDEDAEPSRISEDLYAAGTNARYMTLGDANNDGTLEIVLAGLNYVSVYNDDGNAVTMLWKSEDVSSENPWSVSVGDADTDGQNELLYSGLTGHNFAVYEYLGNDNWGNKVYSELAQGAVDRAIVADVDGDNVNEVIGGGNYQKLTVWERIAGEYVIDYESDILEGFTQGIAAGDFDNDGDTEMAVGSAGESSSAYVFKHMMNASTYLQIYQDEAALVNDAKAGDLDGDGVDEFIMATTGGLYVYDFDSGYSQVYLDDSVAMVFAYIG